MRIFSCGDNFKTSAAVVGERNRGDKDFQFLKVIEKMRLLGSVCHTGTVQLYNI